MTKKIKMQCRDCKRTRMGKRESFTPPEAILEVVTCPDCTSNSWCQVQYFDADGKELHTVSS